MDLKFILDWAEVWPLFIPLFVVFKNKQLITNRPVVIYLWFALLISFVGNCIWKYDWLTYDGVSYNGFLYNIHSIVRFTLFDIYFIRLRNRTGVGFNWIVRIMFFLFVIVNFTFFEKFYDPQSPFSSLLLSVESVLLLLLCLQFYFYKFNSDEESRLGQPEFWMVTGVGIYVVINFFIFLLYDAIVRRSKEFGITVWITHNLSYILLCAFIAKSFYESWHKIHPTATFFRESH